jgi:beta-lactamase superfamily II metal-dependent hydrolase
MAHRPSPEAAVHTFGKPLIAAFAVAIACHVVASAAGGATGQADAPARRLTIYFIDVEGGQSTLVVTPAGESLLVDTGFPSDGTFASTPGDPEHARDAKRIVAAARDAGVSRIDYLLITHFHADHDGGVPELARLLPIRTFIDHGAVGADAEENVKGTLDAFAAYAAVRAKGRHLEPAPGDRLPLKEIEATIVSAAGKTLTSAIRGPAARNETCPATAPEAQEPHENPRSTGIVLQYGRFRFLDVGDLSGPPLFALACPNNLIGAVDVYLVAHHGGVDAASPATFAAFQPRAAIVNNGARKGGAPEALATLHDVAAKTETWQLHKSQNPGARNFEDDRIANLDEKTAHWIKITANQDGSFRVVNGRTGAEKTYAATR